MGSGCKPLTSAEIKLLISDTEGDVHFLRNQIIIHMLYVGGFRIEELLTLKRRNVEGPWGVKPRFSYLQSKTQKYRTVKITRPLKHKLEIYLVELSKRNFRYKESYLFPGRKRDKRRSARPLSYSAVYAMVKEKANRLLDMDGKKALHSLRKSYAIKIKEYFEGLKKRNLAYKDLDPITQVQKALGHKNRETTLMYLNLTNYDTNDFIDDIFADDEEEISRDFPYR
ncbi:MAG: site-specific integrase [Victivallales bacterium]|nr:site-specific integrase [Victivallales bacterium]